jgi:hypothetical protein
MEDEQIFKMNSYLSNIEKEVKEIQLKYTNKTQFESKDIEHLLGILDQIDERIVNLNIDNNENK